MTALQAVQVIAAYTSFLALQSQAQERAGNRELADFLLGQAMAADAAARQVARASGDAAAMLIWAEDELLTAF